MDVCFEDIVVTGVDLEDVNCCKDESTLRMPDGKDSDLIYAIEEVVDASRNTFVWHFVANPLKTYENRLVTLYWFDIHRNTWSAKEFALSIDKKCTELHICLSRPTLSISLTAPIDPTSTVTSISVQDGTNYFEDVCLIAVDDAGDGTLAFQVGITN